MRKTSLFMFVVFSVCGILAAQAPSQAPQPTPPAASTPAPAAPKASPTHLAAAEDLLRVMKMEEATKRSADVMLEMQLRQNPQLNQFKDIIVEFMGKYLGWQELKPEFLKLYTELYTEPELREMISFYGTPLGQKMQATMPQLMARSAEISQKRLQDHMPELQSKIMERVQAQQKQQQPAPGAAPQGGQPGQGQPSQGQPSQGQPSQGQPSQGQPSPPPSTPPKQP